VYGYFGLERHGAEQERSAYGGYYNTPDADPYQDEELRRSVDTEYGERSESPEHSTESTSSGETGGTNMDVPLDDTGSSEPGGDTADTGETRGTEEDRQPEVEEDRNFRVYKRTRTVRE
ncbi:MAG TPA: hypothetical protein VGP38_12845, partial [Rubrobacter sp.]|nr:hypothetical protein [Rubrobacter sp.]